jgi:HPt (histidine-containing phosphotransfer) domain-containing protein
MKNPGNHHQLFAPSTTEELYDLSMLEEMDDNEYVLEMLNILLLEASQELKEMKVALLAGKADIVSQTAHKLKSSAGIIHAAKFNTLLDEIETLAKNGGMCKELSWLVETAVHQYQRIEKELKVYVEELNK